MLRFVVLEHAAPQGTHWDFMLETREALITWALAQPPDAAPQVAAEALPDHRKDYLDYEGAVSGDRGSVTRWDHGTYQLRRHDLDEIAVVLSGATLIGEVMLRRSAADPARWTLSYLPYA